MRVSNALVVLAWFCSWGQALEPRGERVSSRTLPEKYLHWPFSPGENWRITNSYSGLEGHGNGIPFALDFQRVEGREATRQSMARAAAPGRVVHAGPLGDYGNAVVIRHDNDFVTLYGHLDKVSVKLGAEVPALEKLGVAGNTGHSTGAHIHFEVRDIQGVKRWQDGTFVKPEPILGHSDFAGATPRRPFPSALGKPQSYSYALSDLQPTPEVLARDIADQLRAFGTKDQVARRNNSEPRPEPTPPRIPPMGARRGDGEVSLSSQRSFHVDAPPGWKETLNAGGLNLLYSKLSRRGICYIVAEETRLPSGSTDPMEFLRVMVDLYQSAEAARAGYSVSKPLTGKADGTAYTYASSEVRRKGTLQFAYVVFSNGKQLAFVRFDPGATQEETDYSAFQTVVASFRFVGGTTEFSLPGFLPDTGYISEYLGLRWDGKNDQEQCVWAVRQFAEEKLGKTLPRLGDAGAEKLWRIETPGFRKVDNKESNLPPAGALMVWNRSAENRYGHVGVVLGTVDLKTRTVCVIDSNWGHQDPGTKKWVLDRKGQIRHVKIAANIQGWLVRE